MYIVKAKRVDQVKKKVEKVERGKAAPRPKIMHRLWADTYTSIAQKKLDEGKAKEQCTRNTLTNHR